jgi:deoxyadenosine/deoxycytidine kinase
MKLIYVEGNIGTGKTTFVSLLKNKNIAVVLEPVDQWMEIKDNDGNNLLSEFYKDQVKFAFPFQMNSFISRVNVITETIKANPELEYLIVERSVFTDKKCFADTCHENGKMNDIEFHIYNHWHSWLVNEFNLKPHGFIYLKTDPEVSHSRIVKRLRPGEESIPLDYLKTLHEKHTTWLETEDNVLTIDATLDFTDQSNGLMESYVKQIMDKFID